VSPIYSQWKTCAAAKDGMEGRWMRTRWTTGWIREGWCNGLIRMDCGSPADWMGDWMALYM